MSQPHPKLVFDLIGLPIGNLTLTGMQIAHWGRELHFDCLYRYPPEEKSFRLIFKDCTGIQWNIVHSEHIHDEVAQLLTHDLGESNHQRTARISTVLMEVIISYNELVVEKSW